jgi:hypothetical protein
LEARFTRTDNGIQRPRGAVDGETAGLHRTGRLIARRRSLYRCGTIHTLSRGRRLFIRPAPVFASRQSRSFSRVTATRNGIVMAVHAAALIRPVPVVASPESRPFFIPPRDGDSQPGIVKTVQVAI